MDFVLITVKWKFQVQFCISIMNIGALIGITNCIFYKQHLHTLHWYQVSERNQSALYLFLQDSVLICLTKRFLRFQKVPWGVRMSNVSWERDMGCMLQQIICIIFDRSVLFFNLKDLYNCNIMYKKGCLNSFCHKDINYFWIIHHITWFNTTEYLL